MAMDALGQLYHEFVGSEFDWFALDRNCVLGYFSTAGEGWIPDTVLANPKPFLDSMDMVMTLPILWEPQNHFTGTHVIDDWLTISARGIYAFDWNRGTKRYELVASPKICLRLED